MERTELEMVTELSDLWHKQTDDRVTKLSDLWHKQTDDRIANLIGLHKVDSELDCTDCICYSTNCGKPCWCERFDIPVYDDICRYFKVYVKDEKGA